MRTHTTSRAERERQRQIRRYNIKGALRVIAEDKRVRDARRARMEKLLRERWEVRQNKVNCEAREGGLDHAQV